MGLFDSSWFKKPTAKKSKQVVQNDRWDREDLKQGYSEMPLLSSARRDLSEFAATGEEAIADAFWALFRVEPELLHPAEIQPSHLVNREIISQLLDLPETERLRRYSVGDTFQSALSAATMEPDLETLFDRTRGAQQKAQELQEAMEQQEAAAQQQESVDEMAERWAQENPGEDVPEEMSAQQDAAKANAEAAQEAAEQAGEALEKAMNEAQAGIGEALKEAIGKAADDAQTVQAAARGFGLEQGQLQRLPAKRRLELAKKLNNDRFRRIAEKFGSSWNLLISEQQRKVTHHKEEVYDVGVGNDLERVLPQEILNLRQGPTRLDFLRRYSEGKLLQYEMKGTEKLARGAIIFIEDSSYSMNGDREEWAKAIGLALLHFARQQNRAMHIIHFAGPGQSKVFSFEKPSDFDFDKIIENAETFFGGGTHYETPMRLALQLLQKEYASTGRTQADVVFASDGEARVAPQFMDEYLRELDRMGSTTWSICIGTQPTPNGPLVLMSQNKVCTVRDLLSGGDIRSIFRGI